MGKVRGYGKHTYWTEEEVETLRRLSRKKSCQEIAEIMGRSKASVNCKRNRMQMSNYLYETDKITARQLSFLVGQHNKSIHNRWKKAGLPLQSYGKNLKVITEKELVAFMQEHNELWRASQCDYDFFCKYDWFLERLKREREGTDTIDRYRDRRVWTDYELSKVKMLWKRGLSYTEIAKKVGRTRMAVYHKIRIFEDEEWGRR